MDVFAARVCLVVSVNTNDQCVCVCGCVWVFNGMAASPGLRAHNNDGLCDVAGIFLLLTVLRTTRGNGSHTQVSEGELNLCFVIGNGTEVSVGS